MAEVWEVWGEGDRCRTFRSFAVAERYARSYVAATAHTVEITRALATVANLAGRLSQARQALDELVRMAPHTRISKMADWSGPLSPEYLARLAKAYRLAGMPE